ERPAGAHPAGPRRHRARLSSPGLDTPARRTSTTASPVARHPGGRRMVGGCHANPELHTSARNVRRPPRYTPRALDLVLSWPVRIIVIGLLLFSLVVDGAGYIYRIVNHYPLTGSQTVPLPPNLFGRDIYVHKGLDLAGGTQLTLQMDKSTLPI